MNGSAIWADNVINKAVDNYINGRQCVEIWGEFSLCPHSKQAGPPYHKGHD